tara:strand:- start:826 stop:1176 length:351 start_codon:yes stop_codon:yes gene_type:complete
MIKLKNILYEILNTFSVEVDLFVDSSVFISEIINEIRGLEKVTIVTIITPEEYVQKPGGDEYVRLRIKFVTRGEANDALQGFLNDALANSPGPEEDNIRIQGVKSMKFRENTLKRL